MTLATGVRNFENDFSYHCSFKRPFCAIDKKFHTRQARPLQFRRSSCLGTGKALIHNSLALDVVV
jgi:hypothetical protein